MYKNRFKPAVDELSACGVLPTIERPAGGDTDAGTFTLDSMTSAIPVWRCSSPREPKQYEVMEHLVHTNIQTTINTDGHLFPNVRERIRVALEDTWEEGRRSAG